VIAIHVHDCVIVLDCLTVRPAHRGIGTDLGLQTVGDCVSITLIRGSDGNLHTRIDLIFTAELIISSMSRRGEGDLGRESENGDGNAEKSHDELAVQREQERRRTGSGESCDECYVCRVVSTTRVFNDVMKSLSKGDNNVLTFFLSTQLGKL
jgi:hypothetical protein